MGSWRNSTDVADACARLLADHDLGRLLDAGGGEGFVAAHLVRHRGVDEAVVIDRDADVLSKVPPPIQTRCRHLEELDDSDGFYSTILVRQVLHYLDDPASTLARIAGRLRPDGLIYVGQIATPTSPASDWLADFAGWTSSARRRVWTVDSLFKSFAVAGLCLERAVAEPHWQDVKFAGGGTRLPDKIDDLPARRAGDRLQVRVLFIHALLRRPSDWRGAGDRGR